jgi:hypothetical protein
MGLDVHSLLCHLRKKMVELGQFAHGIEITESERISQMPVSSNSRQLCTLDKNLSVLDVSVFALNIVIRHSLRCGARTSCNNEVKMEDQRRQGLGLYF